MSAEPSQHIQYDEEWWEDINRIIEETDYVSRKHAPKAFVELELAAVARVATVHEDFEDITSIGDLPVFESAVCASVDPEIFFPERGKTSSVKKAKALCLRCRHASDCREFAIRNNIRDGIWGGMTFQDRRKMAKMMGIDDGEEG